MQRVVSTRQKLFDGLNDDFYDFQCQLLAPRALTVREADFGRSRFADLAGLLGPAAFGQLLREGGFAGPSIPFGVYSGYDGLSLGYFISAGFLYIFASGEYQPARYLIYLEGVWQLG